MDDAELLDVAERAARAAADVLVDHLGRRGAGAVTTKSSPTDLVSEADVAAERAIRDVLARERPDDAILGEEGEDRPGTSGLRWVVDPLDGTVNYLFGIPQWCVSVACEGRAGVILDPLTRRVLQRQRRRTGAAQRRNRWRHRRAPTLRRRSWRPDSATRRACAVRRPPR